MRWPPGRERRLAGIEARLARDARAAAGERCAEAARARVAALIGERLTRLGIDPAAVPALRAAAAPEAQPQPRDPAVPEHPLVARIRGIAAHYRDGDAPAPLEASLAELLAWCIARAGEPPAGAPE